MAQYELNLRDYWRILRKRRWTVLGMAVLVSLLTFGFSTFRSYTPIYQASATIRYERSGAVTELLAPVVSYTPLHVLIGAQVGVIQGFPVMVRAAKMLGYLPEGLTKDQIKNMPKHLDVIYYLRQRIHVEQDPQTSLIQITATEGDRNLVARMADAVAMAYHEENIQTVNKQVFVAEEFINQQVRLVGSKLEDAEVAHKEFRERIGHVFFEEEARTALVVRLELEEEYDRVAQSISLVEPQIHKLQKAVLTMELPAEGETTITMEEFLEGEEDAQRFFTEEGGGAITILNTLNGKLVDLMGQRDDLLIYYKPDHPKIKELDRMISNVREEMVRELTIKLQSYRDNEALLRDRIEASKEEYLKAPQTMVQLARLEREVALNEKLFSLLKSKHQDILIKEAQRVEEVTIIDPAMPPAMPINEPNTGLNAFLGLMIGTLAGGVVAFARESMDTSLGTIEDVEALLDVPVLGVIPRMEPKDVKKYILPQIIPRGGQAGADPYLQLVTFLAPTSPEAETFRALRAQLRLTCLDRDIKSLMFTSVSRQEGKTTVVVNLGMSLAQDRKRVLLIDADLRKPSIHTMLGIEKEPGLTEILTGQQSWRDVVRTATDLALGDLRIDQLPAFSSLDNLHVITGGSISDSPSELLSTQAMKDLLVDLRANYDVLLLDVPPVLPIADALVLGAIMDGSLIVYQAGNVGREVLKRVKFLLDNVGTKTVGVVLNNVTAEVNPDYLRHSYYYYPYGSHKDQRRS